MVLFIVHKVHVRDTDRWHDTGCIWQIVLQEKTTFIQARDTDGDGILDAGKMLLNQIIFFFDNKSISKFYTLFIEGTTVLKHCERAPESES